MLFKYKKAYVGIDPGQAGGIAVFYDDIPAPGFIKMPETPEGILQQFDDLKSKVEEIVCFIEKQWSRRVYAEIEQRCSRCGNRTKGITIIKGSAGQGKLLKHYGVLLGLLLASGINFEEITPQNWMKWYDMKRFKGESDNIWKNRLRDKAVKLYPKTKITLAVADAVLLAHYCKSTIVEIEPTKVGK